MKKTRNCIWAALGVAMFAAPASVTADDNKTEVEDFTRFAAYPAMAGLKLAGVEGRSAWWRLGTDALATNALMVATSVSLKYAVSETRPDGTDNKSFPSGHAAVAFAAAGVMHHEYGLTRSPWYSVGAYAVAAGTSLLRIEHNRHYAGDVMAGAGIGVLSSELGYFLVDLILKNKGIVRPYRQYDVDEEQPHFFDVQMGVTSHKSHYQGAELGTGTVTGLEGAYFLNRHLGVGGQLRVTATPVKNVEETVPADRVMTDVSLDAGVYGHLALSGRVKVGAKVIGGLRHTEGVVEGAMVPHLVTGASVSWCYRDGFAWKGFVDYDLNKELSQLTTGVAFSVNF